MVMSFNSQSQYDERVAGSFTVTHVIARVANDTSR